MSESSLHYLRGSPWSLKIGLALSLLGDATKKYNLELHDTTFVDAMASKIKSAEPDPLFHEDQNQPVSVPLLFYKSDAKEKFKVIRDGINIVAFLSAKSDSSFGASFAQNEKLIREWDAKFLLCQRYIRGLMLQAGDNLTTYMLPWPFKFLPGALSFLGWFINRNLKAKYLAIDKSIPVADVESILNDANEALKKTEFLLGTEMSYADISLANLFEFMYPKFSIRPGTKINEGHQVLSFSALAPNLSNKMKTLGWNAKFPQISEHRNKVFEKVATKDVFEKYHPKLTCPPPLLSSL